VAIDYSLPASDQVEVSLFGPGVGESMCVHIGDGEWIIVDSCFSSSKTKTPATIEYLEALGVDIAESVKLVIVSHWHDDHVKGMSATVERCKNAPVAVSSALLKKEFLHLVALFSKSTLPPDVPSGISELSKVTAILEQRMLNRVKDTSYPLVLVNCNQKLVNTEFCNVSTLSPSDAASIQARFEFSQIAQSKKFKPGVIPSPTANLNAVAIWVETKNTTIMLGADLETHTNPDIGWNAVVSSMGKPSGKADIVKIPHHGSRTGHCPKVWESMVDEKALGIMTSYSRSGLPKAEDIERLKGLTDGLFITTLNAERLPKRDKVVESFMKLSAKDRTVFSPAIGHVQLRVDGNAEKQIRLNNLAHEVE